MLPKVAIVGRPNVGKSSLLNMLARQRISIVDPTAGVTRDRVAVEVELDPPDEPPVACELIDTGGYGAYQDDATLSTLTAAIEQQIAGAVAEATLVLFVVDGRAGVTPLDERVAELLRQRALGRQPVRLLANKVDDDVHEPEAMEAAALGFGEPLCVSTTTGRNREALVRTLCEDLRAAGPPAEESPSEMRLAIVGKRNAGKSTLVNTLAEDERVITSELPGTTRDSVDVRFQMDGRTLTAIDTAGVRRRQGLSSDVEYYATHRALRSIRRADVVLFLIDATVEVSKVDKHLSQEILEHHKPGVVAINKWDLAEDRVDPEDYVAYLNQELGGLREAPIAFVSGRTGEGVHEAIRTAGELFDQATRRVGTGELNRTIREILREPGPTGRLGEEAKIYYATMPSTRPPTFVLFVNRPSLFRQEYQRFLVNRLRERLGMPEVPVKLLIRSHRPRGTPTRS